MLHVNQLLKSSSAWLSSSTALVPEGSDGLLPTSRGQSPSGRRSCRTAARVAW
jgi:hypothetical protein